MKSSDIELIAKKIVKYIEDHPGCSRSQATAIIAAGTSTLRAWEGIKHLFSYGRFDGARATYKRNQEPYSFKTAKPRAQGLPPQWIEELTKSMQELVDHSENGITGFQIRARLDLDMITFKRASKLVIADRKRGITGKGSAYFPKSSKIKVEIDQDLQPIKYIDVGRWNMPILTQWRTETPYNIVKT